MSKRIKENKDFVIVMLVISTLIVIAALYGYTNDIHTTIKTMACKDVIGNLTAYKQNTNNMDMVILFQQEADSRCKIK